MPQPIDDLEIESIAHGLNSSRTRKRILVLVVMAASFAAIVFAMVFSYSNP